MDGTAVQAIADLAGEALGRTVEIDGVEYAAHQVHDVRKPNPEPKVISVHTLTGLVGLLPHLTDEADVLLHVVSHADVRVVTQNLQGHFEQRPCYAVAGFETLFSGAFLFGQFIKAEQFVIGLQSLFVDAFDRAPVLALVGNLREEAVRTTEDNGITQSVTARQGVVTNVERPVPNPVRLAPFRTFREIEQPSSDFILRLQGGGNGAAPMCALFEADGGEWKLRAIEAIVEWLRQQPEAEGIPVIG